MSGITLTIGFVFCATEKDTPVVAFSAASIEINVPENEAYL